jgi:two-component system, OmpR family, phosphate regulon sensor histidine kinase PhoR
VWTSRVFWRLFLVYAALNLALAAGFFWIVASWQRAFFVDQASDSLSEVASSILRTAAAHEPGNVYQAVGEEVRLLSADSASAITLLDARGIVVAGDVRTGSNLAADREVREALAGRTSQQERHIDGRTRLYLAAPVRQDDQIAGVLLLSHDLTAVDRQISAVQRAIAAFAFLMTAAALVATYHVIGRIVRPLAQLAQGAQAIAAENEEELIPLHLGGELGELGSAFDQMQGKLAQRLTQLKENTERLETVLGSMVEGVIAVSASGSMLLANEASRKLLDMTIADPVGRSLLEVTRSLPVHSAVVEALHSAAPVQREFESSGPVRRVLRLRATRLPGEPSPGVMVVLHDMSELRRLENLRREFVANVSHELKTPLSSIKAYAETLRMGALNDPEHSSAFVARIEEQADRLHQLIVDLLHIARMESGQELFEITEVDLAEVVNDCMSQYADAAAAKRIALSSVAPSSPAVVKADEEGVRTIVSNLIDNAIKYTPEGGSVTVRWECDAAAAVLEVSDTGIGIAEKDQARVFERFYRADKARSREVGGTGLGLSIVKHLAQAFGGSVGLESQPRQGSTFRIRLPCNRNAPAIPALSGGT